MQMQNANKLGASNISDPAHEAAILIPVSADLLHSLRSHPGLVPALSEAVAPRQIHIAITRDGLRCTGDRKAFLVVQHVLEHLLETGATNEGDLEDIIRHVVEDALKRDLAFRLEGLLRPVKALTFAQLAFMEDLLAPNAPLTFGIGPTGTGKTYLAIAAAINLLAKEEIKHIVLSRPHQLMEGEVITAAIRAEREIDEQFAVFYDILNDLIGHSEVASLIERRKLEIAPMGTMRGRTFNDAFILIDEAQNMSIAKMRMVITRAGQHSRICVTGDPLQTDLQSRDQNGLSHLLSMIENRNIGRVHSFAHSQIVRSDTVATLEKLYAGQDPSYFVQTAESPAA